MFGCVRNMHLKGPNVSTILVIHYFWFDACVITYTFSFKTWQIIVFLWPITIDEMN